MTFLFNVILCSLAVAKAERLLSQNMLSGGDLDLGPYDAKANIGPLPDRYAHLSAQDKRASNSLHRLLELLRESFSIGIPPIPPLDPFIVNNIRPIALNLSVLSGKVNVSKVIITGLQNFDAELLELQFDNLRTDFVFSVPLLNAVVSFQANLALGGILPMSVAGTLRVKLENVRVEGAVAAVENVFPEKQFYSLQSLHARFHADNVRVNVDGLNLDADILDSLMSSDLVAPGNELENAKKTLNYHVAQEVLKQLDDILQKFSAKQVKALLLSRK